MNAYKKIKNIVIISSVINWNKMYRSANSYKGSIDGSIKCENIIIDVPLRNSSKIYITHKRGESECEGLLFTLTLTLDICSHTACLAFFSAK